jgi:uncharacterized membrane protein
MQQFLAVVLCALVFVVPSVCAAQNELVPEKVTMMTAKVLHIDKQEVKDVPGTNTKKNFQTIRIEILDGAEKGKEVTVDNDYLSLKVGEVFYMTHTSESLDGSDYYTVNDPYRLPSLFLLVAIFVGVVFVFGGRQGIRGLVSLVGSFLIIFYVLLPAILHGYSPLLVTVGVASVIIVLGSYVTHGFTRSTTAAVIGMILTVCVTGAIAYWSVGLTRLSGFGSEEAVYLNLNAQGSIDILGLLLGGIIIGLLGVLYDAAIGQAVSVEELMRVAPHVSKKIIYERAVRIGREHIGALVNTLAIAYVGASLPLLLLFYQTTNAGVLPTMNTEIFATEIVRIMVGSIGLVLAIPITTLVAVWFLGRHHEGDVDAHKAETELAELAAHEHTHSHGHTHAH